MSRAQLVAILLGVGIFVFSVADLALRVSRLANPPERLWGQVGLAVGAMLIVGGALVGRIKRSE